MQYCCFKVISSRGSNDFRCPLMFFSRQFASMSDGVVAHLAFAPARLALSSTRHSPLFQYFFEYSLMHLIRNFLEGGKHRSAESGVG